MVVLVMGGFGWLRWILGAKANKDSTDARFNAMMDELKEQRHDLKEHQADDKGMHKDVLQELRETNRHLSMTNATLAGLAGKVEAMSGREVR